MVSKLQSLFFTCFYYYSVLLGVTAIYYDRRSGRPKRSNFTNYYTIAMNVIMTLYIPVLLYQAYRFLDTHYSLNKLMRCSNYINLINRGLVTIYTICSRWHRDGQLETVNIRVLQFDIEYPRRNRGRKMCKNVDCKLKQLRLLFYLKLVVFIFQNFATITSGFSIDDYEVWQKLALSLILVNTTNILACTMYTYFLYMWWACCTFHQLNVKLVELLGARHGASLLELQQLRCAHWRLSNIVEQLTRSYQLQILANNFTCITSNIVNGYYALVFVFLLKFPMLWTDWALSAAAYLSLVLDMYLGEVLCERVVQSYRETGALLRRSCELPLDEEVSKMCDQFALQIGARKFYINICGMFHANKRNSFLITMKTIYYTILLYQFDLILRDKKLI